MRTTSRRTGLRLVLGLAAVAVLLVAAGCGANRPPRDIGCSCEAPATQIEFTAAQDLPDAG